MGDETAAIALCMESSALHRMGGKPRLQPVLTAAEPQDQGTA